MRRCLATSVGSSELALARITSLTLRCFFNACAAHPISIAQVLVMMTTADARSSDDSSSSPSASSDLSSSSFWTHSTPPRWSPRRYFGRNVLNGVNSKQITVLVILFLAITAWNLSSLRSRPGSYVEYGHSRYPPLHVFQSHEDVSIPSSLPTPERWLKENSNNKYAVQSGLLGSLKDVTGLWSRPRAALISLVRNSELDGIVQSMRQLEYRWNRKYQYPWVFFNDEPFSEEFKVGLFHLPGNCFLTATRKQLRN